MRTGGHSPEQLANCCAAADFVCWYQPANLMWDLKEVINSSPVSAADCDSYDDLIATVLKEAIVPSNIIVMSNGSFGGIHQQLINALQDKYNR